MAEPSKNKNARSNKRDGLPQLKAMVILLAVIMAGSAMFLLIYHPPASTTAAPMTFEQKMSRLQSGTPLTNASSPLVIPRWLVALVCVFMVVQMLALVLAAYRAKSAELTERDIRQIEFLVETPMFFGLLGSLVGICMMQFISGSLAAPIAYLTSITGIIFYILGRFTILESLPVSSEIR